MASLLLVVDLICFRIPYQHCFIPSLRRRPRQLFPSCDLNDRQPWPKWPCGSQIKAVKVVADAEHLLFWISFPGDLSILQPGGHLEQTVGRSKELLTVLLALQQHLWTESVTLSTAYVPTTVPFTPCPDEKITAFRLRTDGDKIVMTSQQHSCCTMSSFPPLFPSNPSLPRWLFIIIV